MNKRWVQAGKHREMRVEVDTCLQMRGSRLFVNKGIATSTKGITTINYYMVAGSY